MTDMMSRLEFLACLRAAAGTPDLVAEYDRLRGTNLSRRGSPLDLMADDAAGRLDAEFAGFVEFVRDAVWARLPAPIIDNRAGG